MLTSEEVDARRLAARRQEIAERILPSIEELMSREGGFSNITMAKILSASGLSRTTFYRHFTDKTDLLMAVGEPALREVVAAAARPWQLAEHLTLHQLESELQRTFAVYAPHVALLNAMNEVAAYDERVREQYSFGFTEVRRAVAQSIRDGQTRGYVRADVLPDETAGWVTWMGERGMSRLSAPEGEAAVARLITSLAALVWHGVFETGGGRPAGRRPDDGDAPARR